MPVAQGGHPDYEALIWASPRKHKASAATGDENLGERNPKIPRRGRRVTLCHSGARQVNGQKRGKSSPVRRKSTRLGRPGRYVPPGPRFLPKAPSKAGRGKEQGCKADFLSSRKNFQRQKGGPDAHRATGTYIRDGVQRNRVHERGGSAARRMEASLLFGDRAVPVFASGAQIPRGSEPRGHDEDHSRDGRRREMEDNEWNRCH